MKLWDAWMDDVWTEHGKLRGKEFYALGIFLSVLVMSVFAIAACL